jgi:hypothetical protein
MPFQEARNDRLQYARDMFKVFRLIIGQCTTTMRNKVKTLPTYKDMKARRNVVSRAPAGCNKETTVVHNTEHGQRRAWVAQAQWRKLILTQQEPNEQSLEKFADERFDAQRER